MKIVGGEKMKNQNKKIKKEIMLIGLVLILATSLVSAVCCEKTISDAWCQNTQQENCDQTGGLRVTPTSCEGTSFCKPGCCFDSQEGLCMERTPQNICNAMNGTWADDAECKVPQCSLGCCGIGDQASFVTLTRCKRLSNLFNLEVNFRTDIKDEFTCIETAFAREKGACVFESEFELTCRFTTRGECLNARPRTGDSEEQGFFAGLFGGDEETPVPTTGARPQFFSGMLCSAEELGTNCGPTEKTMCNEERNEVYFVDSCGNKANIYDASRINDKSYWKEIVSKEQSCNPHVNNAGSKDCGNCDYFSGSICGEGNAKYGDYICQDLSCDVEINGRKVTKKNGESWCVYDGFTGQGSDLVGSRHFRHICMNGEELVEPCDDFRAKVCIESESPAGDFTEAGCRVNRWKDCTTQRSENACLNTDKRDCFWMEGVEFSHPIPQAQTTDQGEDQQDRTFGTGQVVAPITGRFLGGDDDDEKEEVRMGVFLGEGLCLPNVPPGLRFWKSEDAKGLCSIGNTVCPVVFEEGLIDNKEKCVENCECLEEDYFKTMNQVCKNLGDCGAYVNIAGRATYGGARLITDETRLVAEDILGDLRIY